MTLYERLFEPFLSAPQLLAADDITQFVWVGGIILAVLFALVCILIVANFGKLWVQAYMSGADVSLGSLIGMTLRGVNSKTIVNAQVMAAQTNLIIAQGRGKTTASLEAHYLAGGDVNRVIVSIIAANRAGLDLDFERAAAIDLAGRDLQEAVRTSIFPKVIDCPDPAFAGNTTLSAIAKNGVELLIHVRVTVRTNLDQLIGGATEATIIARVGQGIVTTIGSMDSHVDALASPELISKTVLRQGIQSNTAYEIVSIDIANINVGRNIGAWLQSQQAEADTRVARAKAEVRLADAIAFDQEMKAEVTMQRANLILAEAEVPAALAFAFREGQWRAKSKARQTPLLKPTGTDGVILKFPNADPAQD